MTDDGTITRPHLQPIGKSFDASANLATREKRQELGRQAAMAIHSLLRNAMLYGEDNAVFAAPIDQLAAAIAGLVSTDGRFELLIGTDGLSVSSQAVITQVTVLAEVPFLLRAL